MTIVFFLRFVQTVEDSIDDPTNSPALGIMVAKGVEKTLEFPGILPVVILRPLL